MCGGVPVEVYIGGLTHHCQANAFVCQWCARTMMYTSTVPRTPQSERFVKQAKEKKKNV